MNVDQVDPAGPGDLRHGGNPVQLAEPPDRFEVYLRELNQMRSRGEKPGAEFLQSHDIFDV